MNVHILDLQSRVLKKCFEFLSLEDLRVLDDAVQLSTKHNQLKLLEAMKYATIHNDLEHPIDIPMFHWLRLRRVCPTSFHFGSDDILTWQMEMRNFRYLIFNPFQRVIHIDFDQLLAPIHETIDSEKLYLTYSEKSFIFREALFHCFYLRPTYDDPDTGMLKTVRVGAFHDVAEVTIKSLVLRNASIEHLCLRGCTNISNTCIEMIKSSCQALKSLEFD